MRHPLDVDSGGVVQHVVLLHAWATTFHLLWGMNKDRTRCGRRVADLPSYSTRTEHAIAFARPCGHCFPAGLSVDDLAPEWNPGWIGIPADDGRMVLT